LVQVSNTHFLITLEVIMSKPKTRPHSLALAFVPLVLVTLSCCPSIKIPTELFPSVGSEPPSKCIVPDVVGMDQEAAQTSLIDLGLTPVRTNEYSNSVAAGLVVSLDPPPGTQLDPCQGEVVMVISLGPPAGESSPTAAPIVPPTPAASPPEDDLPMFFTTMYEETFETWIGGFRPEWGVDAEPANSHASEYGELVTEGYVAAYVGDSGWFNYRITFGGADYSQIKEFHVFTRMQDNQNYIGMKCFLSDGWLACEGRKVVNGQEQGVPGFQQTTRLCAQGQIQCDVAVEAIGDQYRVLVNGEPQATFVDSTFSQGGVGFLVDGRWVLDYFQAVDPGGPAMPAFTLFRDDFDTNAWGTGTTDDEYAATNQTIVDGKYRWQVKAKRDATFKEIRELSVPFDPESFPYHFSLSVKTRLVSGPEDAAYGLLFRCTDYDNLYYFRVRDSGDAGLYASENGEWIELVAPTHTSALQPGQENVLRVVADGSLFSMWINGEYVFQANDDRFTTGNIGMAAELTSEGDEIVVEFDDIQVGVP
jgi:hypothetical protein